MYNHEINKKVKSVIQIRIFSAINFIQFFQAKEELIQAGSD